MENIMSRQERAEASCEFIRVVEARDYQEARKLNNRIYESEFNRYKELMKKRREHISQGGGPCSYIFVIEDVLEDLDNLFETGLDLDDRQYGSIRL